jgi:hypothetical protein
MRRHEVMSCPFNRCNYGTPCKHFYRRQRQHALRVKPHGQPKDNPEGRSDLVALPLPTFFCTVTGKLITPNGSDRYGWKLINRKQNREEAGK